MQPVQTPPVPGLHSGLHAAPPRIARRPRQAERHGSSGRLFETIPTGISFAFTFTFTFTPMRICFVCMGNICRSPTAEGVMAKLLASSGLADRVTIDSAGTGAWHVGELPDPRARGAAAKRGIELTHLARQFTRQDLDQFDLIIAMDRDNLRHLTTLTGKREQPIVRLLRSFDPTAPAGAAVPDPYSGGEEGFEKVLDQCQRACEGLLAHVRTLLSP